MITRDMYSAHIVYGFMEYKFFYTLHIVLKVPNDIKPKITHAFHKDKTNCFYNAIKFSNIKYPYKVFYCNIS